MPLGSFEAHSVSAETAGHARPRQARVRPAHDSHLCPDLNRLGTERPYGWRSVSQPPPETWNS